MTTTTQVPGLQRIILINSYIQTPENKIFEFNLSTHTQINGDNGAGKTSLLRLLPFFYGLEPGKITATGNNKKSFSGYYLPEDDSAIIFDYINANGANVHVIITNSANNAANTTLSYRFVPCAFNLEDYTILANNGLYRIKTYEEYKKTLQAKDIKPASLVTTIDAYRAIIQNIPQGDNGQMRYAYSLSSGCNELKFIERITHSLITRKVNFTNIKKLLAEIMKKDHSNLELQLKEQDIRNFCDDVSSFRAIDKLDSELKIIAINRDTLLESYQKLKDNLLDLTVLQDKLLQDAGLIKAKQDSIEIEKTDFLAQHEKESGNLRADCLATQEAIVRQKTYLEKLLTQKNKYQEQKAPLWLSKQQEITELTKTIAQDKETLNSMNSKVDSIKGELSAKEQQYKEDFTKKTLALEYEIKELNTSLETQITLLNKNFAENKHAIELNRTSALHNLEMDLSKLNNEKELTQNSLAHVTANENLTRQAEELSIAISNLQQERDKNLQKVLGLITEKSTLEGQLHAIHERIRVINRTLNPLQERIRELEILTSNDQSYLAGFLNTNVPNWENTIGKVINPKLLIRGDLDPNTKVMDDALAATNQMANSNDDIINIGNITLDTKAILMQDPKKKLETELFNAKKQLSNLSGEYNSLIDEAKLLASNLDNINNTLTRCDNELKDEKALTNLLHRQNLVRASIASEKEAKEQALNDKLTSLNEEIAQLTSTKNNITNDFTLKLNKLEDALKDDIAQEKAQLAEKVEDINKKLATINEQYHKRTAEIEALIKAQLSKEDLDTSLIDTILERIKKEESELEAIKEHSSLAEEYEKWLKLYGDSITTEREKLNSLVSTEESSKDALDHLKKQGEKSIEEYTLKLKAISDSSKELSTNLQSVKDKIKLLLDNSLILEEYQTSQEFSDIKEHYESSKSLNTLLSEVTENYKNFTSARNTLSEKLKTISSTLFDYRVSSIFELWHEAKSGKEALADYNFMAANLKELILEANASVTLLERILPNQRHLLIDNARNIAHMINQYYYQLRNFDNKIKGFSKRLSQIVSENLQFDAFDSFNISLEPQIKNMASWEFIESIADYYLDYVNEDALSGKLPDEEFTLKLKTLADKFENGQLQNEIDELFTVVFEIVEKGKQYKATTANELENLSSNGLNFLLMCAFYIGLIHESRNREHINIHLPVDEMGALANENINRLIKVMNANNIVMVSTVPNMSLAKYFKTIYRIAPTRSEGVFVSENTVNLASLTAAKEVNND